METQKTGERVVIHIHKTVRQIMDRYKDTYSNSLPPSLSNQKMNDYLKEIGQLVELLQSKTSKNITKAGINLSLQLKKADLITTHTARRSFATNLYLDGVLASTIMKITGHRTEKSFMGYIKMTPTENANKLLQHWEQKERMKVV